jgi:hypothetical protein
MKRLRVVVETGLAVAVIVLAKLLVHAVSWEFISLSPLYTSIVAGGIFVIGLLVAGTLADYKESEKMPAEIAAALANIHEDARAMKEANEEFDLVRLRKALANVVAAFKEDLGDGSSRKCLAAINDLTPSFVALERLGAPPPYLMRLRQEQGAIRRAVLRVYHIQDTEFLPSAYILIETVVLLIIAALVFTKGDPLYESVVILAVIAYFFVYLVRLLKIMDTPFRVQHRTGDEVSLFLLNEFAEVMDD